MKKNNKFIWGIVAVLVVVGTILGISMNALVTSPLYPIRLSVVEKVSSITKHSNLDQAGYALSLAEKRLTDLQTLKDQKMLDSKNGILARDNFNQQTVIAQQNIITLTQKEGVNSKNVLTLTERLDVLIEEAKVIFNIDQLEVLDEGVPLPRATTTNKK